MATFEIPPNELLMQITDYLADNPVTLAHLCCMSRSIDKVATDKLYEAIQISSYCNARRRLLLTSLDHPELRRCARMLDCEQMAQPPAANSGDTVPVDDWELQRKCITHLRSFTPLIAHMRSKIQTHFD
jgi:hypothetical protein